MTQTKLSASILSNSNKKKIFFNNKKMILIKDKLNH